MIEQKNSHHNQRWHFVPVFAAMVVGQYAVHDFWDHRVMLLVDSVLQYWRLATMLRTFGTVMTD